MLQEPTLSLAFSGVLIPTPPPPMPSSLSPMSDQPLSTRTYGLTSSSSSTPMPTTQPQAAALLPAPLRLDSMSRMTLPSAFIAIPKQALLTIPTTALALASQASTSIPPRPSSATHALLSTALSASLPALPSAPLALLELS